MSVNLFSPEARRDPFPAYVYLRQHEPVTLINAPIVGKALLITRYGDVVQTLKDPRFSNDMRKGSMAWMNHPWLPRILRTMSSTMIAVDDPEHRRLRNLVHKAFTPTMISRMEQRIETLSHDLLDRAAQKPDIELINEFALPLPLTIISEMLGVPEADRRQFSEWMSALVSAMSAPSLKTVVHVPKLFKLLGFFRRLIELRRKEPQDDLISSLVQAEDSNDSLSEDELIGMVFLLLFAGHETTVNLIGNGTVALLQHPEQLQKLYEHPELIDNAVEELLRFCGPVEHLDPRYLLEDVELSGRRIPAGSTVIPGIASANRDETVFENPNQLDITRNPNRHIAFGLGIHYCLGAPLARLEGRIAIQVLVQRYPKMQLTIPAETLEWRLGSGVRGLKALPIKLVR